MRILLGLSLAALATGALSAPGWPRLPSAAELQQAAAAYAQQNSRREEEIAMPGSPPTGGYSVLRHEPLVQYLFHNPKITDAAQSGEAFLLVRRSTETVRGAGRRVQSSIELLRLEADAAGGFGYTMHVHGWEQMPSEQELGQFLGAYLNSWYDRSLLPGYARDDVWLPGFAGSASRRVVIQGYDGNDDSSHMPFTFVVRVEEGGRPLANIDVAMRFTGARAALADQYALWNADSGSWTPVAGVNLALEDWLPARTDGAGQLIVRGFLDFGRMRLRGLSLPVQAGLEVQATDAEPATAQVDLRHPAFLRNVYFWCARDPQWPEAPRWLRLSYLAGPGSAFVEDTEGGMLAGVRLAPNRYGIGPRPSYPTPSQIPKRVLLNGRPFAPPDWERDYFHPLSENDELLLDLSAEGRFAHGGFSPMPGDGLMVEILWLDGVTGLFTQRRAEDNLLVVKLPGASYQAPDTAEQTWTRFLANQTGDWLVTDRLITAVVVGGATLAGGPAAGAWAAVVCKVGLAVKDGTELLDCALHEHKVVLVRSELALTHDEAGGGLLLYTFDGAPGVLAGGREVPVPAGRLLPFTLADQALPDARPANPPQSALALQGSFIAAGPQAQIAVAPPTVAEPAPRPAAPADSGIEAIPDTEGTPLTASPPVEVESDPELEAAQRAFDAAFSDYTTLVTTGGSGSVEAALERYRQAYERLQALKRARGIE